MGGGVSVGCRGAGSARGGARGGEGGVSSASERHRAADRGEGVTGADQSPPGSPGCSRRSGATVSDGACTLLGGDESRRESSTAANPDGGGGSATPSPRGRPVPGRAPPEGHWGGGRAWAPGLRGPGPGSAWAGAGETGRPWGCGLGGGGAGGLCWLGAEPREAPGGGRPLHGGAEGGGGGCSLPGGRRVPLDRGGGGLGVCCLGLGHVDSWPRGMGRYTQPSAPESVAGGVGGAGGGGWRLLCGPSFGGGVAGGSFVRRGRKNPAASPGPLGPFEGEPRIRRGGLRYMVWYGMVWYGMVWYGMVWYGMVWYGMVWYGMVWYGMVWYGMVWYGMVWYGMVGFGGGARGGILRRGGCPHGCPRTQPPRRGGNGAGSASRSGVVMRGARGGRG